MTDALDAVAKGMKGIGRTHFIGNVLSGLMRTFGNAGATGSFRNSPIADNFASSISGVTNALATDKAQRLGGNYAGARQRNLESLETAIDVLPIPADQKVELKLQAKRGALGDIESIRKMLQPFLSDERLKILKQQPVLAIRMIRSNTLSDEEWKDVEQLDEDTLVKGLLSEGGPFSENEHKFLYEMAKRNAGKDFEYERSAMGVWSPETLHGYAQFIKNSHYTYKPEAIAIDPSIDPTEEHIGPMAQEIEQVNPACVVETDEGVKTVDTGRLALMNAGAIGDLARQNEQQQKILNKLADLLGVA